MSANFLNVKSSGYATLDVTTGRKKLAAHFKTRPNLGVCPKPLRVPVTITGYIDYPASFDDGASIEFVVCVEKLTVRAPKKEKATP